MQSYILKNDIFLYYEQQNNMTEFYFQLWPSIILLVVSQASYTISRSFLFDLPEVEVFIGSSFLCLIEIIFYCILIHTVITWIGQTYCESIVQKTGNEELFNNLEQALIILD